MLLTSNTLIIALSEFSCLCTIITNKILRRIFRPKRNENGEWRRLHNEELHSLYRSPNISRRLRWAGHVARMEKGRTAFIILTGTPTGNRPLGRGHYYNGP